MSMPSFPVPMPAIGREDAVNQLLSSAALAELSISHILNAGGEALQYILGTLAGREGSSASASEVLAVGETARELLDSAAENRFLLNEKLREILSASTPEAEEPSVPVEPKTVLRSAYAANTRGTILVVTLTGVSLPLPDGGLFSDGITLSKDKTTFTLSEAGRYLISYEVNTTSALNSGVRLLVNEAPLMLSTIAPMRPTRHFSNQVQTELPAGATVSLQMFGEVASTALMPGGTGAAVSIVRLS